MDPHRDTKEQDGGRDSKEEVVYQTYTDTIDDNGTIDGDYKVYKRRFFGLAQLVLLNIVVSWDVCIHSI